MIETNKEVKKFLKWCEKNNCKPYIPTFDYWKLKINKFCEKTPESLKIIQLHELAQSKDKCVVKTLMNHYHNINDRETVESFEKDNIFFNLDGLGKNIN